MTSPASSSEPLLSAKNIKLTAGERVLCENLSLDVRPGEIWALTGPSGVGKSTLLRALSGALPQAGAVKRPAEWAEIPQGLALNEELSAFENVCVAQFKGVSVWRSLLPLPSSFRDRAEDTLRALGLSKPHQRSGTLSGGERQRVAVARALLEPWQILLADEPISQLDGNNARAALTLLREEMKKRGGALVLALHHEELAKEFATRRIRLFDGGYALE